MKKLLFSAMALIAVACNAQTNQITIKGKISFPSEEGQMEVYRPEGFDRVVMATAPVNPDGTYVLKLKVDVPGAYQLNCQNLERVEFWAEDENLEVNFRGIDTAKMRFAGPTYVHIKGGPNNEFMNQLNWLMFRNYWTQMELAQIPYQLDGLTDSLKQEVSFKLYESMLPDLMARIGHLVTYYGDVNSLIAALPLLESNTDLYNEVMARFEARDPNYEPLVRYKQAKAEALAAYERVADGMPAPLFSYATDKGDRNLGPEDFRGNYLVIDFWASWCGPCRAEIPHLKEAYEKYHDKGVEMLSVSIDKDDAAWRKAMEQEAMPWHQVKAPDVGKEVMNLYQFSGIPHIVIIDKEGNIVGTDYRGQALMDKLEELTE